MRMLLGLVLVCSAIGCESTTFDRGATSTFHPRAAEHARLVDSAIEVRDAADLPSIEQADGVYLGDLDVDAGRTSIAQTLGPNESEDSLKGRVSLEVASRGGTHFHAVAFETESGGAAASPRYGKGQIQRVHVRYAIYRVEPLGWPKLDAKYRPEHPAAAR
jgi:hypothetical protein